MTTSTANLRRIQNEVKALRNSGTEYDKLFKIDMVDDNIYHWNVILYGPQDSLYTGCNFKLDITIPYDYPFSPPHVKFLTPIQHLNINNKGDICLNILKNDWAPSQNIKTVILSILLLLSHPNPDDPFNSELAELYRKNEKDYEKHVKKYCQDNSK